MEVCWKWAITECQITENAIFSENLFININLRLIIFQKDRNQNAEYFYLWLRLVSLDRGRDFGIDLEGGYDGCTRAPVTKVAWSSNHFCISSRVFPQLSVSSTLIIMHQRQQIQKELIWIDLAVLLSN